MLARIRKSMNEKDQGFTLIELLVVMIIIGILAAIAVPVFLNQRKKAADTATKSDIRAVVNAEESYAVDAQDYTAFDAVSASGTIAGSQVNLSTGTTVSAIRLDADGKKLTVATTKASGFCVTGKNDKGTGTSYFYNSMTGGFTTACPA